MRGAHVDQPHVFRVDPPLRTRRHGNASGSGRRLPQQRRAACHIVTGSPRNDLIADAPPFLAIGRKYGFDTEALVFNLVGPHAKMNFALSRPEANDVAAYIQSLAR
jgi:mono/diheme cytochrome c family protein